LIPLFVALVAQKYSLLGSFIEVEVIDSSSFFFFFLFLIWDKRELDRIGECLLVEFGWISASGCWCKYWRKFFGD
jgi:hypothetical protein